MKKIYILEHETETIDKMLTSHGYRIQGKAYGKRLYANSENSLLMVVILPNMDAFND